MQCRICFRTIITDVQQRANIIQGNIGQMQQGGGGGGGAVNPQMSLVMHELQENLRNVKQDMSILVNRPQVICPKLKKLNLINY